MGKLNNYFCIDARKIDKIIKPNSVQVIITSPPYFDVKNYDKNSSQIGWNQDFEDYLSDIKNVFQKCLKATTDTGMLWLVIDTYRRGGRLKLLPLEIMRAIEEDGWIPQDIVIWDKVKNLPYSRKGQFRNNFEYVLLFSKMNNFKYYIDRIREIDTLKKWWVKYPERYNPKGKVPENIWRMPIPNQGSWGNGNIQHVCPFPPKLVERMILLSTDEKDIVLDPFAGSGIVLAQAKCMNRRFIGCDINKGYVGRFYSKVLPEIEKLWTERTKELSKIKGQQEELKRSIISLRKLKFGKIVLKKAIDKFGRNKFKLIVLESNSGRTDEFLSVTIVLSNGNSGIRNEMNKWANKHISVKPLSKFGIFPHIKVMMEDSITSFLKKEAKYYIYLKGQFYDHKKRIDISDLPDDDYDFPPIISDIKMSIDMIKKSSLPYP